MKQVKSFILFTLLIGSLYLNIMGCQKQKDVVQPPSTSQQSTSRIAFSLNRASTRCRISLDTAIQYTTAFREQMEKVEGKKPGDYTIAYTIPAEGLLDLFTTAEQQGNKLKAIRAYRGIKNGKETLVYIGVDENDNDLIPDNTTPNYDPPKKSPIEDEVNGCPGTCLINPNILTGK